LLAKANQKNLKLTVKPKPHNVMKKFVYFLLAFAAISFVATSCADEEIKPATELQDNGGGLGNVGSVG
jgi:hypothetical protein